MERKKIFESTVVGKCGVMQLKKDFEISIMHYPKSFAADDRFDVEVNMDGQLALPIEKCISLDDAQTFADDTAEQIKNGLFINKLSEAEYKRILLRRISGPTPEDKEEKLKKWIAAHKVEIPEDIGEYAYAFTKMKF